MNNNQSTSTSTCHKCNDSVCPHYVSCNQGVCFYCILDGNADLIENVIENECWGGNFYEICRPAQIVLDFGQQDACNRNTPYQWDESAPIIWSKNYGDPRRNVACFRELYLRGFHAQQMQR